MSNLPALGSTLPNGATVVAVAPFRRALRPGFIVFAIRPGASPDYVTWEGRFDSDGSPVTFWGDYLGTNYAHASANFLARCVEVGAETEA